MNRILPPAVARLCLLSVAALLAGCAALTGPREVVLPVEKLQETLVRKLPASSRYLELFDISVTNPRLQLSPENNRVVVSLDAAVAPVFSRQLLAGSFRMSGVLAIDAVRQAVVVQQPRMEELTIDGVDTAVTGQLARIGGLLASRILRDVPIYSFSPEQFRYAGVQFFPSRISTTPQALVVTFEPVK